MRAQNSAVLASNIFLVCRPRTSSAVGDWRTVLAELNARVATWLPHLASEGIDGADAIFACLGPAIEPYSRYGRVETSGGQEVTVAAPVGAQTHALLPAVWGAVAREALRMVFEGAETEGLEEDARFTSLWLWTLRSKLVLEETGLGATAEPRAKRLSQVTMDFDTARKLAQALGVDLSDLGRPGGIVHLRGDTVRLVPVTERRAHLLSADKVTRSTIDEIKTVHLGGSTLDRIHQAMLLFGTGNTAVLRRLLVQASDDRLIRLSRGLSALYPASTTEKRWIDGVLTVLKAG